ncbi:anoctamin-1 isoform X2 [Gouania willdenowi]|uniref:anoctamin-1 isoform X2 n=2 Tax=Gouania willdenowi TaxID=441366 RepID=UPI00105568A9|nr:anoctamin-1-like isoform X2 [Gouania willdenowi]
MSESSSYHSEKLVSLAHSLSGLGLDAANGGNITSPDDSEPPPPDSGIELGPGLFFADGKRKVDYILCYKNKKRRPSRPRLSVTSNGSIPIPLPMPIPLGGRWDSEAESAEASAPAGDAEESKLSEEEKAMMREEFERGLLDAGLQIERDKEKASGLMFIRLHIPWPILSREAELEKIKVAVKKKCELRKRTGIVGMWESLVAKLNKPFQPDVPDLDVHTDSQTSIRYKTLKHHFIRDKLHLYDIKTKETVFDNTTRSRIVAEIISRTSCRQTCQTSGINSLLARGVYVSAYPLHDGSFTRRGRRDQRNDRQLLYEEWANYGVMCKYQPVDLIRKYFGEQIGFYFAWLGVYTQLLIPPSVLGIFVFLYGIFTVDDNVPSQETCDNGLNITMCPLCDAVCDYWHLSSVCSQARASYLFDNGATVLFAIFMSLWAALFLEHWKRRQMYLKHSWDLTSMEDEEEGMRPEYEEALQEKKNKMKVKFKKKLKQIGNGADGETDQMLGSQEPESLDVEDHLSGYFINISTLIFLIFVTFSAVFGVAVYRICMLSVWSMNPDPEAKASVRMTVTTTGIILNMLVVLVLEEVYGAIAVWLTEIELPKTTEEFEERLIFKSFFLKSMNAFAPLFYVAFFKGRFAGRPGDYVYIFGDYRMEECAPPGCLIELCIQLSMIMLGKQLIQNNVFEVLIPKLKKMYRTMQEQKGNKRAAEDAENDGEEQRPRQQFDKDFTLEPYEGVSPEYMEMIIQYGFVTLFVASFPLAPAFALLNNVIEIRLDAAKFVTEVRRPDAVRCKDIGIWFNILCGISKFSVITNAFVISFTSEFVPRMMFKFMYSVNGTMSGYTQHSLSYFSVNNFPNGTAPSSSLSTGVTMCRYKDYRDPPWEKDAYTFSKEYWSILAAKLAFVIFFQNLAMFLSMLVAWMVPDVPRSLREQLKKENMMLMEFLVNHDEEVLSKARSPKQSMICLPTNINIVVESPEEEELDVNIEEQKRSSDSEHEDGTSLGETEGKEEPEGNEEEQNVIIDRVTEDEGNKFNKEEEEEDVNTQEEICTVDVDAIMKELGFSDEEPLVITAEDQHLLQSSSKQDQDTDSEPSSKPCSSLEDLTSHLDAELFSLIALPPPPPFPLRDQSSRPTSRCSTLPSRHKATEVCYGVPRSSHSTSLTRFQMDSSLLASSNPFSPHHPPPQTPTAAAEHFTLRGPPPQQPRSRGHARCSTLPPRQRPKGFEELSTQPIHSSSFTQLGEHLPPSSSEL